MAISDVMDSSCQDCLRRSSYFNNLIPEELEYINRHKEQILYQKGETICKQGAFANYVMYVADGLVKTYLESVNEKIINLKIIKSSEFVGFSSLCGTKSYNYSAVALKKSVICLVDSMGFKQLLMKNGHFAIEIMRLYCSNEAHIYSKLNSIGHKYMLGRLADALLYLCDKHFAGYNIFEYIHRKDIADFACISKESTIKLLTEMNDEKIITLDGKCIKINDEEELRRLSLSG